LQPILHVTIVGQAEEGQVKLVIQRVSRAEVRVEGKVVGCIGTGFMVLVGLERDDTEAQVEQAARRIATLRVFEDEQGKMNRGLDEIDGAVLAVSQFTLAASIRKGRRPGFDRALPGDQAEPLFNQFVDHLRGHGVEVETGEFGAYMDVELVNSGPVTLLWDSQH
jgi:D-tyrosyl-tRNA(Tyr) deacylase